MRDWIEVRDVVRALGLIKELASDTAPRVNIGTGVGTSVREVAGLVVAAWPKRKTVSFNGEARPGDPFSLLANTTRLSAMGFTSRIQVEDGIEQYVRWFLSSDRVAL